MSLVLTWLVPQTGSALLGDTGLSACAHLMILSRASMQETTSDPTADWDSQLLQYSPHGTYNCQKLNI